MRNKKLAPQKEKELPANISLDEALIGLPEEKREQILVAFRQEVAYSGPIPPPNHFAQYENVLPGAADRILSMAEREQEDRHRSNKMDRKLSFIGLWLGAILTLIIIGVAVYAIFCGAVKEGVIVLGTIIAISGIYVLRKSPEKK